MSSAASAIAEVGKLAWLDIEMFQQASAASFTVIGTCAQISLRCEDAYYRKIKFRGHVVLHKAQ